MFSYLFNFLHYIISFVRFQTNSTPEELQDDLIKALADLETRISEEHFKNENLNESLQRNDVLSNSNCFKKTGIITRLEGNYGTIDNAYYFDVEVAKHVLSDLAIGCKIEYLAYKISDDNPIKIVKVLAVINDSWDKPNVKQTDELLENLKNEKPEYFTIHQRSILGCIIERKGSQMKVECDKDTMMVDLENIQSQFVPIVGDHICLNCNVQSDTSFVDMSGEILEVISMFPTRSKNIKGTITEITGDYGLIEQKYVFSMDVVASGYRPIIGDIVVGDVIESNQNLYNWRCLKVILFERNIANDDNENVNNINTNLSQSTLTQNKNDIIITDNLKVTFDKINEKQTLKMIITNTSTNESHKVLRSVILGKFSQSQMFLKQPHRNDQFFIEPGKEFEYRFEINSRFFGQSIETIVISFAGGFKIGRNIEINVDNDCEYSKPAIGTGPASYRNTNYTQSVWNQKYDVIPGVKVKTTPHFIGVQLPQYEVPDHLKRILTYNTTSEINEYLNNSLLFFGDSLTLKNYAQVFQSLLHLEEIQLFHNMRSYDMERGHFTQSGEYLVLEMDNIAETRPSLVLGDTVRVTNPWIINNKQYTYEGCIHKVLKNRILLKFTQSFHEKYNGEDYKIEFYFSRSSIRKQHYAVKKSINTLGVDILFPSKISLQDPQLNVDLINGNLMCEQKPLKWYNPMLNEVQKEAIKNVLNGVSRPLPYVIFGPPGTGKTMTVIETILQIFMNISDSRILVGTPSNSSANLITERLIDSQCLQPGDFIRIVGHNSIERELIPERLLPFCATCEIATEGTIRHNMLITDSGLKLHCNRTFIGRHKITIGTCLSLGSLFQMSFAKDHFTHTIIDECGQCRETETLIPLVLLNKKTSQIILSGDPMQLGPVILSRHALERGLDTSFLVRLLERFPYQKDYTRFEKGYDSRLVTKLIYNYRSIPSVMKMYNDLFYESELIPTILETDSTEAKLLLKLNHILPNSGIINKSHGLFFIGVRGKNQQCTDSPSWFNGAEAKSLFLFLLKLYNNGLSCDDIGIITPYQQQVKAIRTIINDANIQLPKIGSVEEFQGQERQIILMSTVRSATTLITQDSKFTLGFVKNSKRLNVAISRGRALVVVFGNPHLLLCDQNWKLLIEYCTKNNAYIGCDLPKSLQQENSEQDILTE